MRLLSRDFKHTAQPLLEALCEVMKDPDMALPAGFVTEAPGAAALVLLVRVAKAAHPRLSVSHTIQSRPEPMFILWLDPLETPSWNFAALEETLRRPHHKYKRDPQGGSLYSYLEIVASGLRIRNRVNEAFREFGLRPLQTPPGAKTEGARR